MCAPRYPLLATANIRKDEIREQTPELGVCFGAAAYSSYEEVVELGVEGATIRGMWVGILLLDAAWNPDLPIECEASLFRSVREGASRRRTREEVGPEVCAIAMMVSSRRSGDVMSSSEDTAFKDCVALAFNAKRDKCPQVASRVCR